MALPGRTRFSFGAPDVSENYSFCILLICTEFFRRSTHCARPPNISQFPFSTLSPLMTSCEKPTPVFRCFYYKFSSGRSHAFNYSIIAHFLHRFLSAPSHTPAYVWVWQTFSCTWVTSVNCPFQSLARVISVRYAFYRVPKDATLGWVKQRIWTFSWHCSLWYWHKR